MPSLPNIAGSRLACRLFSSVRVRCWWDLCDGGWVDRGWWWGLRRFFFQISNTYFLGTENVPYQPLTIFERVAFIGHWNVRPHANPTIITLSHYPNTIPLFPFQSHFPLLNPTIIISIPLFAHQSHFFGRILIIPLLLFSYILVVLLPWYCLSKMLTSSSDKRRGILRIRLGRFFGGGTMGFYGWLR